MRTARVLCRQSQQHSALPQNLEKLDSVDAGYVVRGAVETILHGADQLVPDIACHVVASPCEAHPLRVRLGERLAFENQATCHCDQVALPGFEGGTDLAASEDTISVERTLKIKSAGETPNDFRRIDEPRFRSSIDRVNTPKLSNSPHQRAWRREPALSRHSAPCSQCSGLARCSPCRPGWAVPCLWPLRAWHSLRHARLDRERDRLRRTRRDTRATTGTGGGIQFGQCHPPESRAEADSTRVTAFATHPAFHTTRGKTGIADRGHMRPGPLFVTTLQGRGCACRHAISAKRALATGEIDPWESAAPGNDHTRTTDAQTVATARAARDEFGLDQGPRRAEDRRIVTGSGTEKCATGEQHAGRGRPTPQDGKVPQLGMSRRYPHLDRRQFANDSRRALRSTRPTRHMSCMIWCAVIYDGGTRQSDATTCTQTRRWKRPRC